MGVKEGRLAAGERSVGGTLMKTNFRAPSLYRLVTMWNRSSSCSSYSIPMPMSLIPTHKTIVSAHARSCTKEGIAALPTSPIGLFPGAWEEAETALRGDTLNHGSRNGKVVEKSIRFARVGNHIPDPVGRFRCRFPRKGGVAQRVGFVRVGAFNVISCGRVGVAAAVSTRWTRGYKMKTWRKPNQPDDIDVEDKSRCDDQFGEFHKPLPWQPRRFKLPTQSVLNPKRVTVSTTPIMYRMYECFHANHLPNDHHV